MNLMTSVLQTRAHMLSQWRAFQSTEQHETCSTKRATKRHGKEETRLMSRDVTIRVAHKYSKHFEQVKHIEGECSHDRSVSSALVDTRNCMSGNVTVDPTMLALIRSLRGKSKSSASTKNAGVSLMRRLYSRNTRTQPESFSVLSAHLITL